MSEKTSDLTGAETRSVQGRRQWAVHHLSDADGAYVVPVDHARRSIGCSTNKQADRDDYALQICALRADPHKRRNVVEDATLLATAPELADAVEMLLDVLDELDGECSGVAEFQAPIRMARAIHAKATGAQP